MTLIRFKDCAPKALLASILLGAAATASCTPAHRFVGGVAVGVAAEVVAPLALEGFEAVKEAINEARIERARRAAYGQ